MRPFAVGLKHGSWWLSCCRRPVPLEADDKCMKILNEFYEDEDLKDLCTTAALFTSGIPRRAFAGRHGHVVGCCSSKQIRHATALARRTRNVRESAHTREIRRSARFSEIPKNKSGNI